MSTGTTNSIFQAMADQGELSQVALQTLQIVDYGAQIKDAMGISVDDVQATETTIVTMELDDSGSMSPMVNEVVDGVNSLRQALLDSKQGNGILLLVDLFNAGMLSPYTLIKNAPLLDRATYERVMGGTPLYDKTVEALSRSLAKKKEFSDNAVPARTYTVIVTDGEDLHSRSHDARSVRRLVEDMLNQEDHLIFGVGISNGRTEFKKVFGDMGIPDNCILTPKNTNSEVRKAFQFVSQSAVRASQSAANFSSVKVGGFGA